MSAAKAGMKTGVTARDRLAAIAARHGVPLDRLLEEWSERSAIREYLGGMPRAQAELAAVRDACEVLGLSETQENP